MPRWVVNGLALLVSGVLTAGSWLLASKIDAESVDPAYYSAVAALIPLLLLTLFTAYSRLGEAFVDVQGEITEVKTQLAEDLAALDGIRHQAIARGSAGREQRDQIESQLGQVKQAVARVEGLAMQTTGQASGLRRIRVLQNLNVLTAVLFAAGGEGAALATLASAESSEFGFGLTVVASVSLLLLIVVQILDFAIPGER